MMKTIPDLRDTEALAEDLDRPCLIPLVFKSEEMDAPASVYRSLREKFDHSFLLESLVGPQEENRYSVIGCGSLVYLKIQDGAKVIEGHPEVVNYSRKKVEGMNEGAGALEVLKEAMFMDDMRILSFNLPRYVLGVTGYLGYDFVRSLEDLDSETEDDLDHPTLEFVLPESVIVFDHLEEDTYFASLLLLLEGTNLDEALLSSRENLRDITNVDISPPEEEDENISVTSNFEKKDFERSVDRIKEYIRAGDVIQTVISRRIDLDPAPELSNFYSRLREINPSPYMFFLDFPDTNLVGSSPEALIRVQDEMVMTRPIAGTRKRGKSEEEDKKMEEDLLSDEKEKSEHIMLVDLGRNDIGKVSKFGSVDTPEFMEIEKYGDVQHIVSTVTGDLKDEMNSFDALRAVFPTGTVTGAPKIRAMEIIEELEPTRRGIYSGAVGTFSYTGSADFAITIRTLTSDERGAHIQVGAGIVADSQPENEYYETQDKARSLLRAAGVEHENCGD